MGEGWHVHVRDILVDKGRYFNQTIGYAFHFEHRPRPDWRCGSLRCALAEGHCSLVAAVAAIIVAILKVRPGDAVAVAALHWLAGTAHTLYFTTRGVAHVTLCRHKQH